MKLAVHYLIRDPARRVGLVYPSEMPDPTYVGFRSFYLMGAPQDRPAEAYTFHAVRGESVVSVPLRQLSGSRGFFRAVVADIGSFIFHAQGMPTRPPYSGKAAALTGLVALRRLRSWRPNDLDAACRTHEFYFAGYSPRLGAADDDRERRGLIG